MRKTVIVVCLAAIAVFGAFANGNAEKLTSVEGTVILAPGSDGGTQIMLRTASGDMIVDLPAEEMAKLQLRAEQHIRVSGVFIGVSRGGQTRARIVARVVTANGEEYPVENPVRLTAQDRVQIRTYEQEQQELQTQTQLRTGTQTREGEGSATGSGNSDTGRK